MTYLESCQDFSFGQVLSTVIDAAGPTKSEAMDRPNFKEEIT